MRGKRNPFVAREGIPFILAALAGVLLVFRYLGLFFVPLKSCFFSILPVYCYFTVSFAVLFLCSCFCILLAFFSYFFVVF